MFEASHLQHNPVSGYIKIVSGGHQLPAFWSHPDLGGPFPGLVLLHDQWGLTSHIRNQARRFAEMGYYVIAPDLLSQPGEPRKTGETLPPDQAVARLRELGEAVRPRVAAALHALKTHIRCSGQMGLIGWGVGAELALRTAVLRDDLDALSIFYVLPTVLPAAELRLLNCPLLALVGLAGPDVTPDQIEQARAALVPLGSAHKIVAYPDAARDFFDDSRPTFDSTAAEDAWTQVIAFVGEHLKAPAPGKAAPPETFDPGNIY